jgi:phosphopantothenoylcysteine synthetase/decarboxylase
MPFALVTAGATRNPVDPMRYLSARSTGATGIAIARALVRAFDVLLLGSAEACLRAPDLRTEEFGSTRDLFARMERLVPGASLVVHSAAVGDYEAAPRAEKIASGQPEVTIRLTPAPKILDRVRAWNADCTLVSFKAGSPELDPCALEAVARAQLVRTGSDLVFANSLGALETSCMLVDRREAVAFASRAEAVAALLARIGPDAGRPSRLPSGA